MSDSLDHLRLIWYIIKCLHRFPIPQISNWSGSFIWTHGTAKRLYQLTLRLIVNPLDQCVSARAEGSVFALALNNCLTMITRKVHCNFHHN